MRLTLQSLCDSQIKHVSPWTTGAERAFNPVFPPPHHLPHSPSLWKVFYVYAADFLSCYC